jgi:hypothetical protein
MRYMPPKANNSGGSAIYIISTQTNRSLTITTPFALSWGISDFIDKKTGESDGKFKISIDFREPIDEDTQLFVKKFQEFEERVKEDAVKNSPVWWKKNKSMEVLEETFFPTIKYPNHPDTGMPDKTRQPSIRAKIPFWDNKWDVEIFDTNENQIFPCEDYSKLPADFVPSKSQVSCVLQCGGVWIGGKGWGVTWKCKQIVVKPYETVSLGGTGKCFVNIKDKDRGTPVAAAAAPQQSVFAKAAASASAAATTTAGIISGVIVEDSDDDTAPPAAAAAPAPAPVVEPAPVPVVEAPAVVASVAAIEEPAPVAAVEEPAAAAPVKKMVKKTFKKAVT